MIDRSLFIFDPAGESESMAGAYRAKLQGKNATRINPWEFGSACVNPIIPLAEMIESGEDLGLYPNELANSFIPQAKSENTNAWVQRGASVLVSALLRHGVILHGKRCTPGWVYDQIAGGRGTLETVFRHMFHSEDPVSMQNAMRLEKLMKDSPRELAIIVDEATNHMLIYQEGSPPRRATNYSDISPAELKADPMTVFFQVPGDQMAAAKQYVATIINCFIEGVAMANGPEHRTRTLFLLNEFTQMGKIACIFKALHFYRKFGVQLLLVAHSRAAVEGIYGEEGRRDFEENCEFMQILGTDDPGLIKSLSTWSGITTVETHDYSISGGPTPSVNHQIRRSTRPVLQAENIRSLAPDEQLIKYQNMPLLLAKRRFWKDDPKLSRVFDDPADIPGIVK
ncbi:MAG: type IV secretory system conjugative DNA transfer family protein [Pseudomonadota bacterium]